MKQVSEPPLVLDTSAFFGSPARLKALLREYRSLATLDLVCFEFMKVVNEETDGARASRNRRRLQLLANLRERFPRLLEVLEVQVTASIFTGADVEGLYALLARNARADPADAMIWLKMQKQGWKKIATDDVDDYGSLGAAVVPLRR